MLRLLHASRLTTAAAFIYLHETVLSLEGSMRLSKRLLVRRMERCADPNCRRATKLTVYGAAPLQKVVFVFSGFNERISFIFVAKNTRFFVRRTRSGGADRLGTARSGV